MFPRLQFVKRQTGSLLTGVGQVGYLPGRAAESGIQEPVEQAIITGVAEHSGAGHAWVFATVF